MRTPRVAAIVASGVLAAGLAVAAPNATHAVLAGGQGHTVPGNGLIVFESNVTGLNQLYTVRPDGSRLRQITHVVDAAVGGADWSPDGRRLIFTIDPDSDEGGVIAIANADGSGLRTLPRLTPPGGSVFEPSWSPDGRTIFYSGGTADAVFRVPVAGGAPKQVTHPPAGYWDGDPNVSPDGRTVSFLREGGPDELDAGLFTVDLRTGRERQLTPYSFNVSGKHAWSPDGRRITFTRDFRHVVPGVSGNVMTIAADGSDLRKVTRYAGGEVHGVVGSYSPDGQWILFREQRPDRSPLKVVRPDGGGAHALMEFPGITPRGSDWGAKAR